MKPTRTVSSYVLLVGVIGLSIVGGIVAYQIYSATIKSQTTQEQAKAIKPLDGVINQSTIDSLRKRVVYSDTQMGLLIKSEPTPEATEAATISPEATEAATISPEATASTTIQ
ncbi:MAG TPA: hypothetical protein VLH94_03170 [Spirochaetia bacterium]|nr:hypothetical protein [Spirochaetia bacterium]